MTAIIVLNWNGASDTICCLSSLKEAEGDFLIIVADNGSTDNSVEKISLWCENNDIKICVVDENHQVTPDLPDSEVYLLKMKENYGFAKGNNKALSFAKSFDPDTYLLLNNDTEVLPDFLTKLKCFSEKNPKYRVLTPKICYFNDKKRIWNCGGRMFLAGRRYHYAKKLESEIKEKEKIEISFVTGCALFFYPELLDAEKRLFTERFFFGEEDFEFSIRMKRGKIPMACVLSSKIYHKVSATGDKMNGLGRLHVHYLNRTINIRQNYSPSFFVLWKFLNFPIMTRYFYNATKSLSKTIKIIKDIYKEAGSADGVSKERFLELVNS